MLLTLVVLLSLVATGVLVFVGTLPEDRLSTVRPGSLEVAADATGEWHLGTATISLDQDRLVITDDGNTVLATDPGTAFVTGGRGGVGWEEHRGYFWPEVDLDDRLGMQRVTEVDADRDRVVLRGELSGDGDPATFELTLTHTGQMVVADLTTEGDLDAVGLVDGRSERAGVHGLGEQFSDFDLDGRLVPIVVREQGVGRGTQPLTFLADLTNHAAGGTDQMTYAAWLAYVTDDLRSLRLDPDLPESHAFAVADLRDPERVGLEVWASRLRAQLTGGATPAEVVTRAGDRAGPAPSLATWTQQGAIVGLQGGTETVRREVAELTEAGTRVAAVWLQDWTGQRTTSFGDRLWWTWQLDQKRYPGWADLVADLDRQGIRTTTYVNPFLVDAAPKGDDSIRNLFAEAKRAGHLVTRGDGSPYLLDQGGFDAALVDLTDPDAREWFADVIAQEVLAHGVDGFMADFGEGLPFDAHLAEGDPATEHNRWPLLWAQTVERACALADRPDCVTWFRSGAAGMDRHAALFWNGDQLVDFGSEDGLASALLGTFSAGVSGWPLVHSDIGGYTSINAVVKDYTRPDDLLRRWAEYAAFGVVMRTHEGNRPDENAQVYDDSASEEAFARMTQIFVALADYRTEVIEEAARTGLPAIRHGWLVHPGTDAAEVDTQFFLGSSILVAPVLEHDTDTVEVTFPPGRWVHLITGEEYDGDRRTTVDAPLGTPAAFVSVDDPAADTIRAAVADALEQ